jgi:hypothetical protein
MLRHVALVINDVSEELSASFIRVTRIGALGTTLAVTSNRRTLRRNTNLIFLRSVRRLLVTVSVVSGSPILVTLMKEALSSYETTVLTRETRRNIPEDDILLNLPTSHSPGWRLVTSILLRSYATRMWTMFGNFYDTLPPFSVGPKRRQRCMVQLHRKRLNSKQILVTDDDDD